MPDNHNSALAIKKMGYIAAALFLLTILVDLYLPTWLTIAILSCNIIIMLALPSLFAVPLAQVSEAPELKVNQQQTSELKQELAAVNLKLQQSSDKERLYKTVLDLIPDWIYVKDIQHNYVFANQSFQQALPNLQVGFSDDKFMPIDFCQKIWRDEQTVMKTGQPIKDAEEQAGDTWFSTSKVIWKHDISKQVNGLIGVTRNVTEAVNDRQQVQENAQKIQAKISRVYAIQSETDQAKSSAGECSNIVGEMTNIITQIDEKNEQIVGTIELIKALASQSKLLSINAAIEAAKAGESGRGFGVVAHEVRELAERSEQAVKEIQTAIKASSQVVSEGTHAMEETNQAFSTTITQIDSIAQNLNQLSDELKAL